MRKQKSLILRAFSASKVLPFLPAFRLFSTARMDKAVSLTLPSSISIHEAEATHSQGRSPTGQTRRLAISIGKLHSFVMPYPRLPTPNFLPRKTDITSTSLMLVHGVCLAFQSKRSFGRLTIDSSSNADRTKA